MRTTLRPLAAGIALALLPACLPAHAQGAPDPADEATRLDTIVVTGARVPRALSELPISVSTVDQDEIADQLAMSTNVLETLDVLVPGLTTSQEEARMGCRTNIRGRPAQFLINGVPTNDNLRRSSCSSLYSLSPFAIERMEVLRGATALYGAGAPGGAINLITRRARSTEQAFDLALQYSANPGRASGTGETNVYAGTGRAFADWDYYAGIGVQDYGVRRNPEGGVLPGTTFDARSFNGSVARAIGATGELRATALHYVEDPRDFYGTDFTQVSGERLARSAFIAEPRNPNEHEAETTQSLVTLAYEQADVLGHALAASVYWHDEQLVQRAADWWEGDVYYFDSDAENSRLGLRTALNRSVETGAGTFEATYGLDLLRQRYYRPELDNATGDVVGYVSPEVLLDSTALFLQAQYRTGPWLLTGGLRQEWFRGEVGDEGYDPSAWMAATPGDIPDFDLLLGNVGVVYELSPRVQLFAGFNQGAEIAEFGRAARGVADPSTINLDAATSDQVELGVRGRAGGVDFSAAAFRSQSDRAASLQADDRCAGEPLCPLVPLRLAQDIHGVELTADWRATEAMRLGGLFTWQRGEFNAPGATPVHFGTDTLAPMRTTAYVEFAPDARWQARLQATYSAATDVYDAAEEAQGYRDAGSTFLVDVSAGYAVGPGTLYVGVSNLLDEAYVNATNQASGDFFYYLSEGRRATVGYRIGF